MEAGQKRSGAGEPFFAARERLDIAQQVTYRTRANAEIVAARYRRDNPQLGTTRPNGREDRVMAVLHLRPWRGNPIWCDERHSYAPAVGIGGFALLDQRHAWVTDIRQAFETINIFIPRTAFLDVEDERPAAAVEGFHCPIEQPHEDAVMLHLGLALLPGLEHPKEMNMLFADYVFGAMRVHLARTYARLSSSPPGRVLRGRLAFWQERRVKHLLLDELASDHTLAQLAAACEMSVSHFAHAFRTTTGVPPHRWLLQRRVDRAKELLQQTTRSLSDIALACGFADQSHLTRVFTKAVGTSPGAWRQQVRH